MSDVPIPEDILERALKLASWTFGSSDDKDVMEVAAVLMAQDERIACRADKWADDLDGFVDKAPRDTMREFASAIRRGTP